MCVFESVSLYQCVCIDVFLCFHLVNIGVSIHIYVCVCTIFEFMSVRLYRHTHTHTLYVCEKVTCDTAAIVRYGGQA